MTSAQIKKRVDAHLNSCPANNRSLRYDNEMLVQPNRFTPWDVLYRAFFRADPHLNAGLYICKQINLLREIEACKITQCDVNDNFLTAVYKYSQSKKIGFSRACALLEMHYQTPIQIHFNDVFTKIISEYGFKSENQLYELMGYGRSVINAVRNNQRPAPKQLLYALCLFLDYDIGQCEQLFHNSQHSFHHCFPDNVFRAYVQSDNKGIQPCVDIVYEMLDAKNSTLKPSEQWEIPEFLKRKTSYSCLVVSDFKVSEDTYDYSRYRIKKITQDVSYRSEKKHRKEIAVPLNALY